ncbi:MAG: precorrin-6y C5,15-methyltransferase (decarboxylating) subunit CbiE, partial [Desulfobaccales bacterium]
IQGAQVLAGGRRLLDYFPDHPGEKIFLGKDPETTVLKLKELARERRVVVLASGDPNFYGIGPLIVRVFGTEHVVIHPNLTTVQAAAARLKAPWHEAKVVSLHGRGWEALEASLDAPVLYIYTDPVHTPGAIARRLLDRGRTQVRLCVLEEMGQDTERFAWLNLEEAAGRTFSPLNMVVVEQATGSLPDDKKAPASAAPGLHLGMPEEAYSPERGLITKAEVRAVVLSKLELHPPGQVLWDVGAGSGSVGLEASLLLGPGRIFAVEKNPERAAQITANRDKFGVANLEVVCGQAPDCLASLPTPDRVFIGGGGDAVEDILQEVLGRLRREGKVVLTASRLETLEEARRVLRQEKWSVDVIQLQVCRAQPLSGGSFLQALNPVWIVTGQAP